MINNDGVFSSTRSVEERVRVLEEALKEAQFLIGELKRQLLQAEEDYRTKLRKKSATLIAWQSAYDELKEKYKRIKSRHRRECSARPGQLRSEFEFWRRH
ncbi:hypothetical protein Q1695_000275 [Nippostrongylus brasiliensis]|nr:hypothetical protein Q1695_000275 [Nippostrongylus brasiliensis]